MGQEASLPQENGDASLEEQAKAPPSVPTTIQPARTGRKLMSGKLFQRNENNHQSYEQREAARAAAAAGNTMIQQPSDNMLQQEQHELRHDGTYHTNAHHPVIGVMYEKTKKTGRVASGRGAAIINSMRNLSLGVRQSNKKGVANDWEKQWDEDEDDESDGEEEMALPVAAPLHPPPPQPATDDGLEWDTAVAGQPTDDKPNMEMFLPMLRVLGKGSFGKVVLVQKRVGKERGQLFAMKILRKTHLVKRRQIERTRTERKVLSLVNHPFIMKLHYAFQSEHKLYLVLDYCPGGELFFHLSRFRRFPERVARFYSAELLLAIGHLHKRGIIYRDLKPENVLLDADGHVKLGDFGLAKAGIVHPLEGAMSMCGTPEYMAPEVLTQQGHGFCVDYWGLGMIVYEMMTGLPPWYTTDRAKLFRKLKSAPLDLPSYFSGYAAGCVTALLERDPRRRLGVTGIRTAMEHEFFRNISWRSLYSRRVEAPIRPCEGWKAPSEELTNEISPVASTTDFATLEEMNAKDLEVATQNFDNQFTRMPVESEDSTPHDSEEAAMAAELNPNTFRGFSFDGRDGGSVPKHVAAAAAPVSHLAESHSLD